MRTALVRRVDEKLSMEVVHRRRQWNVATPRAEVAVFSHDGTIDLDEYGDTLTANAGIRDSDLSLYAKAVAWALNSRAKPMPEEGWVCWPSVRRIAADCGMSRSKAYEALSELRAAGLVTWESGDCMTSNYYTMDYVAMAALRKSAKKKRRGRG